MPVSVEIQNKVVEIASNKVVNNKAKLAVRKRFYELEIEEITLKEVQDDFDSKVTEFNLQLDDMLEKIKQAVVPKKQLSVEIPEVVDEPFEEEEIIVPKKEQPKIPGVRVRMQEELEDTTTDDTDFEVPFAVDDN